jgi:Zn-dependent protease
MSSFPGPARATPPPPPAGGEQPPPQGPYGPGGYQPFQQYYQPERPPAPPRPRRNGVVGWLSSVLLAVWAVVKYGGLLVLKFGALKTLITLVISFGAYAVFFGPWFAGGLVLMILVHEMGHVVEIRRQGMQASAPLFIPFLGAAIFQRQHPTDAFRQAQIGIAGPIAGTIGATVAFIIYGSTHQPVWLVWAYLGFFINLINLIPVGMLDGGWIMAVVSKWFQVIGLGLMVLAVIVFHISLIFLIFALLSIPTVLERFRNDRSPYFKSVPVPARLAMGAGWLALVGYLGFAMLEAHNLLFGIVG